MNKQQEYRKLVGCRKECRDCGNGLVNQSSYSEFDSDEIGPWSKWQGNLDADIMVVGQDWGNVVYFVNNQGKDNDAEPTCKNLIKRFMEIGIDIGTPGKPKPAPVFLTNSILCLKPEGKSANVFSKWQRNCCSKFLKPLIGIIKPKVVIALGEKAYRAIMYLYGKKPEPFKAAVDNPVPVELENGLCLFPVYHCSQQIINSGVRGETDQKRDWARILREGANDNAVLS